MNDLELKAEAFLKSRKNANVLIDIVSVLEENGPDLNICIKSLETIFIQVLEKRELCVPTHETGAQEKYQKWLVEVYENMAVRFLDILVHGKPSSQVQVLDTMIKLLTVEGKFPFQENCNEGYYFPNHRLEQIMPRFLSSEVNTKHLISKFKAITTNQDVIHYAWKIMSKITNYDYQPNEIYIRNFLDLIDKITPPKDMSSGTTLCGTEDGEPFPVNVTLVRKWISKTWSRVMKWQHTPATHKQLLILLLEHIMTHLKKPVYLTDFLMNSIGCGGAIGVLGLQGMLTLIQSHNLDYPNIYGKLYSMIQPQIFHMKYKSRLFYLTDLFLTSSHISQQLVAAFAKRLARLTLVAPPPDIHIMVFFIGNLIIRHPGLNKLLVGSSTDPEKAVDPFDMDQPDPLKSGAIDSFLWEIYNLQRHYLPTVASLANQLVNSPLPSIEWDLAPLLETTEDDLFDKELKKKPKEITLTYSKPSSMKLPEGEKLLRFWSLT